VGDIEARSNTALASPLFKKKGNNILKLKSVAGTGCRRGYQNPTALSTLSQVSINKPQLTHFPHSPIVE
jgi:hypothetical protein